MNRQRTEIKTRRGAESNERRSMVKAGMLAVCALVVAVWLAAMLSGAVAVGAVGALAGFCGGFGWLREERRKMMSGGSNDG